MTSVLDLRLGVLLRGLAFADTTLLMVIDSALFTEPTEPRVWIEPSVWVLDSLGRAVESSTNSRRASGDAISISAALLFIEPCKLYMLSRLSMTGFIFSSTLFLRSRLVILGARALEDCMMTGLGRGFNMELFVEPRLEMEVLEGVCRSWLFLLASSLIRAISNGNGGRITSGAFPIAVLCRLVDLCRICGRSASTGTSVTDFARWSRFDTSSGAGSITSVS